MQSLKTIFYGNGLKTGAGQSSNEEFADSSVIINNQDELVIFEPGLFDDFFDHC